MAGTTYKVRELVTVEVEMLAFAAGEIRPVDIPKAEFDAGGLQDRLELAFAYGQNDFQPKAFPSVSVGDVVRLGGKRYRVANCGFEELA